ncbi:hypothetical protein [Jeotgalibacillus sp. JSM ZJ347]|uniref:hypothetical protein n=1 Tax=Jeotgalibacillus sp. JSM ZJ347 TaxID=3342117 RepID=UPI0035A9726A
MYDPYLYTVKNDNSSGISASRLAVIAGALTTLADFIGTIAAIKAVQEEELSKIANQKRLDQQNQILADLQAQIASLQEQLSSEITNTALAPSYSITIENLNLTIPSAPTDQKIIEGTDL